jgi:hypothetical protein
LRKKGGYFEFRAVFEIDAESFHRKGRVCAGGMCKAEPEELGRSDAGPVAAAIGGWKSAWRESAFVF